MRLCWMRTFPTGRKVGWAGALPAWRAQAFCSCLPFGTAFPCLNMTLAAISRVGSKVISCPAARRLTGFSLCLPRLSSSGRCLRCKDGIVSRYLRDHCPDSRVRLCAFRDQLPATADEFLWDDGVFGRLGRFDGLGEEMRAIVLGSLRDYPLLQIKTALAATVMQLTRVATGEGVVNTLWHTYGIVNRYTPAAGRAMRAARQQRGEIRFHAINAIHIPIALGAMALLPLFMAAGLKWSRFDQPALLARTIAAALLVNAFVCGALANPHDRYGARLTWLAPLAILLDVIRLFRDGMKVPTSACTVLPRR